jgi:tRNA(Ile)-lysidine synthetase-like protein
MFKNKHIIMNRLKYESILEKNLNNVIVENSEIINEQLYENIYTFITNNNYQNILISLSGGVDSMVLTEIMHKIRQVKSINIYCIHINYNNRNESVLEKEFLMDYCDSKEIHFECIDINFTRNETNRKIYEQNTRKLRYDFYKKMCEIYNCPGVFLGHHEDDLCENIFNNIMRGNREITDLCVLKRENEILKVNVFRPMLDFRKNIIYDFAHNYDIPYFLDTTPNWSCRGKMRNNIFPACEDCYSENYKNNLLRLGNESNEIGHIFQKYIINDLFENNFTYDSNKFIIKRCDILNELYVFKIFIRKICYYLKIDTMRLKNIEILIDHMKNDDNSVNKKFTFIKNYYTTINKYSIEFVKSL